MQFLISMITVWLHCSCIIVSTSKFASLAKSVVFAISSRESDLFSSDWRLRGSINFKDLVLVAKSFFALTRSLRRLFSKLPPYKSSHSEFSKGSSSAAISS